MRERFLRGIARATVKHTYWLIGGIVVITLVAGHLSEQLKLQMHFRNLMPQDHPMVKEFNRIVENYQTASMIIVAAQGKENELKQFAEEAAAELKKLTQYVQRVDYKLERDFFLKNGLLLVKAKDLRNNRNLFTSGDLLSWLKHLNDSFEQTYVYDEESISTKEKENEAIRFLDGVEFWLKGLQASLDSGRVPISYSGQKLAEQFLIGEKYYLSPDKDMLLIFAQPTFTLNEIDKVVVAENTIDSLLTAVASKYPGIFAGTTGTMALSRDEMVSSSQDMYYTTILAIFLIIGLFILSFRMWVAPLLAGITLLIGIIWSAGFAAITLGSLNIMTSMFAVILIGLGVDFSIHLIALYTENRSAGLDVQAALESALLKSGKGIMTGAFTTACAFLTLMISKTAGMSEFGLITGSGVIFCMMATLIVLPVLIVLREKIISRRKKRSRKVQHTEFRFLGKTAEAISRKPNMSLLLILAITFVLLYSALQIKFDYNYLNMEPVGLTSIRLQHQIEDKFDLTPDFALVTANSVEEARRIAEKAKQLKMIGMVTSITQYLPSPEEQQKRLPILREIKQQLARQKGKRMQPIQASQLPQFMGELDRLEANVIEFAQLAFLGGQDKVDQKCRRIIGDMEDPDNRTLIDRIQQRIRSNSTAAVGALNRFQRSFIPAFQESVWNMCPTQPITLADLPDNIVDQFMSKDGTKFLVSIYPKEAVWNLAFLKRFTHQMNLLDERITGIPNIFYVLMQIVSRDGKIAAAAALMVIFLLLLIDFRSIRPALLAMVPLLFGGIWMLGIMNLLGQKLTVVNVMGLPLILGIGVDDGVHLIHRYRLEGGNRMRQVFTSTGRAIFLTSLTTMLAFGSLKFATYRGLGSLGGALFIGVGTCFLTTVLILPTLLALGKNNTEYQGAIKK